MRLFRRKPALPPPLPAAALPAVPVESRPREPQVIDAPVSVVEQARQVAATCLSASEIAVATVAMIREDYHDAYWTSTEIDSWIALTLELKFSMARELTTMFDRAAAVRAVIKTLPGVRYGEARIRSAEHFEQLRGRLLLRKDSLPEKAWLYSISEHEPEQRRDAGVAAGGRDGVAAGVAVGAGAESQTAAKTGGNRARPALRSVG